MKWYLKTPTYPIWRCGSFNFGLNYRYYSFSYKGIKSKLLNYKGSKYRNIKLWPFISISLGIIGVIHLSKTKQSYNELNTHLLDEVPFSVLFFKLIPLKAASWIWGSIMNVNIPSYFRPFVYSFYSKVTGANIDEVDGPLLSYSSMNEFFIRKLKRGVHSIDPSATLVSPSDGKVLGFGSYSFVEEDLDNILINHVKGFKFPLTQFLGEYEYKENGSKSKDKPQFSFIKPSPKKLYYCSIYLAPSDYHRFHSPTNWTISCMRRISGEQLPVFPALLRKIPLLYVLNERVPLLGTWNYGRFSMTLVGSTNVGSIKIYGDTNSHLSKSSLVKPWIANVEVVNEKNPLIVNKGDDIGYFKMGSTIVLVFEAPENFEFSVKEGDPIRMGQKLGQLH